MIHCFNHLFTITSITKEIQANVMTIHLTVDDLTIDLTNVLTTELTNHMSKRYTGYCYDNPFDSWWFDDWFDNCFDNRLDKVITPHVLPPFLTRILWHVFVFQSNIPDTSLTDFAGIAFAVGLSGHSSWLRFTKFYTNFKYNCFRIANSWSFCFSSKLHMHWNDEKTTINKYYCPASRCSLC